MGTILLVLLLAVLLAGSVLVYAAYPYRGEQTPVHPRVGEALRRGVASLPTVDPREQQPRRKERVAAHR